MDSSRYTFRGKRRHGGEWLHGNLSVQGECVFVFPYPGDGLDSWDNYEVDPLTIGQCTGLVDRDNALIFEGDIIKLDLLHLDGTEQTCITAVDWEDSAFVISTDDERDAFLAAFAACPQRQCAPLYDIKIIGNTHDDIR